MRKYSILFSLLIFTCANSLCQSRVHSENVPHQPNWIGKNICLGIEPPLSRPEWSTPTIVSSNIFGTQVSNHRIIFGQGDELDISEMLANSESCVGIVTDEPRWQRSGKARFCLKTRNKHAYVSVGIELKSTSSSNEHDMISSIYSVASCQIGDVSPDKRKGYFYGETLKVDDVPMLSAKNGG